MRSRLIDHMLQKKVTKEYNTFRQYTLKIVDRSEIYAQSHKITTMFDIYLYFQGSLKTLNFADKQVLYHIPNILETIYIYWLKTDDDKESLIAYCVKCSIEIERNYKRRETLNPWMS